MTSKFLINLTIVTSILFTAASCSQEQNEKSSTSQREICVYVFYQESIAISALDLKVSEYMISQHPSSNFEWGRNDLANQKIIKYDDYEWQKGIGWSRSSYYDPPRGIKGYTVPSSWIGIGATGMRDSDNPFIQGASDWMEKNWCGEKGKRYEEKFLVIEVVAPVNEEDYKWIEELCPTPNPNSQQRGKTLRDWLLELENR